MKTSLKIIVALFAILCAACDDYIEMPPANEKKLIRIKQYYGEYYQEKSATILDFKYDQRDRLIEVQRTQQNNTDTLKYNWDSYKSIRHKWDKHSYEYFIEDGKISNYFHYYNDTTYISFVYDQDGYIKEYEVKNGEKQQEKHSYTWENRQLSLYDEVTLCYNSQICKGFFPLLYIFIGLNNDGDYCYDRNYLFMAHPNLIGVKTTYLPTKILREYLQEQRTQCFNFEYKLDQNDYIISCTVLHNTDFSSERYTYKFVWE